jgi:hypothetical protein
MERRRENKRGNSKSVKEASESYQVSSRRKDGIIGMLVSMITHPDQWKL